MFPHISDPEFANAAGVIEDFFQHHLPAPARPHPDGRLTHVDHVGYGRFLTDYLTARARGLAHESAVDAMRASMRRSGGLDVAPPPPLPMPGPEPLPVPVPRPDGPLTRLRVEANRRWFANASGRFDWREVSAFSLYSRWLQGQRDEVKAFARVMRGYGFTMLRVLFTLDGEYWKHLRCAPDMPGFWSELPAFFEAMADEGCYVRAVLIGALEPFGAAEFDWSRRPDVFKGAVQSRAEDYCLLFAEGVADVPGVVLELANEPLQIGLRDSFDKLIALGHSVKALAPETLLCGGAPDGVNDQDVRLIVAPFDFADVHIERRMDVGGLEWVKRSGEYAPIDQEHVGRRMPFVSGEPVNFGERRLDGRTGDVEPSPMVAFCYAAVSRSRHYNACFHYDGGLWSTLPKPETVECIRAFMLALDTFPMLTAGRWRGHWSESFFQGAGIYPQNDDPRIIDEFVRAGHGPWRVFGAGDYAVTIAEPPAWDFTRGLREPATRLAHVSDGRYASSIYRRGA